MKILVFYQYFGTPKGSWSTRIYELTRRWVKEGYEVTVITSPYDKSDINAVKGKLINRLEIEGIKLKVVNFSQSNKHSKLYRMFTFFMYSFISLFYALFSKYDLALCSSGPITVGVPGLLAKKIRRKKFVFEVRDLWPDGAVELGIVKNNLLKKLFYRFEKSCYLNSDFVVACSEGMKRSIVTRFPSVKTIVVPNACDEELFSKKIAFDFPAYVDNRKVFVYTGSLGLMDDCMQIMYAIEALGDQSDLCFVFIGDGAEKQKMEKFKFDNNLDNVYFEGLIPKTDVVGWLQNSYCAFVTFKDLDVLSTSSPNKMFDAFAAGVPLIQTTKGWIYELFNNEECGLNAPSDNPKMFAEKIKMISSDLDLRNKCAGNALRVSQTLFSRDNCSRLYINEIGKLR